jgi:hypothetical protein
MSPTIARVGKLLAQHRRALLVFGTLTALSVVMSAAVWDGTYLSTHEDDRYAIRAVEYLRSWRDGDILPRWAPDLYGGYGSPTFVFFPPVSIALTCAFALLGFSILTSLKLAGVVLTCVGAYGAYLLVLGETGLMDAALIGSAAFLFAPYRFVDLTMRGDLAEYGGYAALPLTLYFFRALGRVPFERIPRNAFFAACALALVLTSHPLAGLWTVLFLPLFFIGPAFQAWRRRDRFRALSPFFAGLGGCAISAVYSVPAVIEKANVHYERALGGYYAAETHVVPIPLFFKLWYYEFAGEYPPDSRMPFSIGFPLALAMGTAVLCVASRRLRGFLRPSRIWWAGVVLVLVVMSPLAVPLYENVPFAKYIQFPWRLLGVVAAVGAAAVGTTWAAVSRHPLLHRLGPSLVILALVGIVVDAETFERTRGYIPLGKFKLTPSLVAANTGDPTTNAGDHLPRLVEKPPSQPRGSLVNPLDKTTKVSARQRGGTRYTLDINASTPWAVELQVIFFPGWRVETTSGPSTITLDPSPNGYVRLQAPSPGHYKARVSFGPTWVRGLSALLTLASLLLMWPVLARLSRLGVFRPVEPA